MTSELMVVIDPDEDLVDRLISLEWWARETAWPDRPEDQPTVDRAADLVGDLAITLHAAQDTATTLYAPDGHVELGAIVVVDADVSGTSAAVQAARLAASDDPLPDGSTRTLHLLDRCAECSRLDFGAVLAAAVLAAVESDRPAVRLDSRQYRAYQQFIRQVLDNPLDRWAALGSTTGHDPAPMTTERSAEIDI